MKSQIKKLLNEKVNKLLLLEELSLLIERELAVGTTLTNKLENINKEYAKTLLDFLKSNKISDKVTIDSIDYTSDDDKTVTGYFKDREGKTKVRRFGVGKLLNYIGIGVNRFKGYELQDLISNLKKGSLPEELEFRVFEGDDILWAYHCDNYYEDETMSSCMRYDYAQKYLSIYTENPDSVKCLVLLNKEDGNEKVVGRALLWTMDNGKIYMDRIYAADEHASDYLFFDYAEKNGINESYDRYITPTSSVTLEYYGKYEYYPYMDTFMYYNKDSDTLSYSNYNRASDNVLMLQKMDGGYTRTSTVKFKYGNSAGQHIEYNSESDELEDAKLLDYKVDGEHIKGYASIDDVIELYDGETVLEKDARRLISSKYVDLKNKGYRGNQNIYQYGFKDDVVQLNPDFYEENVYAYFEDVAKVVKQPNGEEFWVLEDDVEDFEDYLYENVKIDSPMKNLLREKLNKFKLITEKSNEEDTFTDKHHYPKEIIKQIILGNMNDIINDNSHYFSFVLIPIAIDFLGKCISSDKTFTKNQNGSADFDRCIKDLMPSEYKDTDLHNKLRNGMLNMLKPKDGVGLTHAKEAEEFGLKHLEVKDDDIVLVVEELWEDVKKAANKVIDKKFSDSDKMSKPFIDVPQEIKHKKEDI